MDKPNIRGPSGPINEISSLFKHFRALVCLKEIASVILTTLRRKYLC